MRLEFTQIIRRLNESFRWKCGKHFWQQKLSSTALESTNNIFAGANRILFSKRFENVLQSSLTLYSCNRCLLKEQDLSNNSDFQAGVDRGRKYGWLNLSRAAQLSSLKKLSSSKRLKASSFFVLRHFALSEVKCSSVPDELFEEVLIAKRFGRCDKQKYKKIGYLASVFNTAEKLPTNCKDTIPQTWCD